MQWTCPKTESLYVLNTESQLRERHKAHSAGHPLKRGVELEVGIHRTEPMGLLRGEVGLEKHTPPPPKKKYLGLGQFLAKTYNI